MEQLTMKVIAHIENDYTAKFAIPRQSGLVEGVVSTIVFEPGYRKENAFRGLEGFSHLWLLWIFSKAIREGWSPTVLPPRLGGKTRMGVFATRSPFRPNPVGLSSVRLLGVDLRTARGPVLRVAGADLMDGTPIFDIKPYIPFADSHPDAAEGYTAQTRGYHLEVRCPDALRAPLTPEQWAALSGVLAGDPRPSYQDDPSRVYGMRFAGHQVRFTVADGVLTVCEITPEG